ncbi:MAG: hypothetical protein ACE5JX_21050, partial [Acidobacteriota bacterium]
YSAPKSPYAPYLLTTSGSVFVLRETKEVVRSELEKWLRGGLPLPGWAVKRYGDSWRTCPFVRENGFGEIALNLPCHTQSKPVKFQEVTDG